jgi:hypothetical protein
MAVPFDAKVCGHCRANLGTGMLKFLLGTLLVIFVLTVVAAGKPRSPSPSSSSPAPVPTPSGTVEVDGVRQSITEVDVLMQQLMSAGLITKVSPQANEVQVSRALWEVLNLDRKKAVTLACALYFEAHGETSVVTIVDNRSGRKLATHGAWAGVKVLGE